MKNLNGQAIEKSYGEQLSKAEVNAFLTNEIKRHRAFIEDTIEILEKQKNHSNTLNDAVLSGLLLYDLSQWVGELKYRVFINGYFSFLLSLYRYPTIGINNV